MTIGHSSIGELSIGEVALGVGAQIDVPVVDLALATTVPFVSSGGSAHPPVVVVAITALAPALSVNASVPLSEVVVATATPNVSANSVRPPSVDIVVGAPVPRAAAGVRVDVSNTDQVTPFTGSVGEHSVGESSIGVGDPDAPYYLVRPPIIIVQGFALEVHAGKRVDAPAADVVVATQALEIDARKRSVKIQIIAS